MWYRAEIAQRDRLNAALLGTALRGKLARFGVRVAVVVALAAGPLARAAVSVGDPFPELSAAGLTGGAVPDTHGKVVLVDFWASWCAPCKASFPAFARLHEAFADRGFVIVAVSVDEKPAAYAAFVKKWQPPFTALLDREQRLVRAVNVPAMPTSYLIARDGRVRSVHQGFHGSATEKELHDAIETLLAESS